MSKRVPICKQCSADVEKNAASSAKHLTDSHSPRRLKIHLIKPSKYDDDGYVIRYWKGVLPSNTLACLYGLTEDVRKRQALGPNLKWQVEAIDETVQKVDTQRIIRESRKKNTHTLVCLVGVQSNQFPRAYDLALELKKSNIDVMIGGFHVSGVISTLANLSPELADLKSAGVILVAGEIEHRWEEILRDVLTNSTQPVYNFLHEAPDLSAAPMPEIPKNLLSRYAVSHFATLDCGRGCPFQCSFCTVINVQGRQMRFRAVNRIIDWIRDNYREKKISYYFFTDDNFSRNKNWELIFDGLIQLRKNENIAITFMIQVDTLSHKIQNFITKASQAGCRQVFIGMESLNEENLKAASKKQNKVSEFSTMIEAYHSAAIATHLAYIIGFPFDTAESVQRNMANLLELNAEQASFFMLTPLPGSMDYVHGKNRGFMIDADLNNFDTFHETYRHAQMRPGEWTRVYESAWQIFYAPENLKRILTHIHPRRYWDIFLNFIWCKNSIQVEKGHPMIHGFFRFKDRLTRRGLFPRENPWVHFKQRLWARIETLVGWCRLLIEMEEVWLITRPRSRLEKKVLFELGKLQTQFTDWRKIKLSTLQSLYRHAAITPEKNTSHSIPSKLQLWIKKLNLFSIALLPNRSFLNHYWKSFQLNLKHGHILRLNLVELIKVSLQETALLVRFVWAIIFEVGFYQRDVNHPTLS